MDRLSQALDSQNSHLNKLTNQLAVSPAHSLTVFTYATGPPSARTVKSRKMLPGMMVIHPSCGLPEVSIARSLLSRSEISAPTANDRVRITRADLDRPPFPVPFRIRRQIRDNPAPPQR